MNKLTFKQKQAHYEKVRRSNYLASLRLAGFDSSPADLDKPLLTREEALAKYLQVKPQQSAPTVPQACRAIRATSAHPDT
jgi:hypothetical protein